MEALQDQEVTTLLPTQGINKKYTEGLQDQRVTI